MNNITIRTATPADLPTLLTFEQGVIEAERPYDCTLKEKVTYYDISELISQDHVQLLVAECDGQLIASGYAKILDAKPHRKHSQYAYLGFMYVDPEHRGKGLNKLIVDGLMDWSQSRGIDEVRLDVYDGNGAAVRAYEKAGFSKHMVEMRMSIKNS